MRIKCTQNNTQHNQLKKYQLVLVAVVLGSILNVNHLALECFVSFIWRVSIKALKFFVITDYWTHLCSQVLGEGSTLVLILNCHRGIWLSLMADGLSKKRHLYFSEKEGQQSLVWHCAAAVKTLFPCGLDCLFSCVLLLSKRNRPQWFHLAQLVFLSKTLFFLLV